MPVAFDSAVSTGGAALTDITISHTVGAGGTNRLLVVGISLQSSTIVVNSVTYAGAGLTSIGTVVNTGTRSELWRLINPNTGANNVVSSFSGSISAVLGSVSLTGVSSATPTETYASNTGTSSAANVTGVITSSNGMVIDTVALNTQVGSLVESGTERWNFDNFDTFAGAGQTKTGTTSGTLTMNWTNTAAAWAIGAVGIQATSAGGAVASVVTPRLLGLLGVGT